MACHFSDTQMPWGSQTEPEGKRETEDTMCKSLWVCGTPAGGGGYCHFPSWDCSCGVPRTAHTPLSLGPHVIEEDTPCVWPLSCGQWLGSHSQANSKQAAQHPGELWQWTPCCEGTCRYFWNITTEKRSVLAWTLWEQDLSHLWSICRSYWSWYQFTDVNRTDIFQCPENSAQHYERGNTFLWSVLQLSQDAAKEYFPFNLKNDWNNASFWWETFLWLTHPKPVCRGKGLQKNSSYGSGRMSLCHLQFFLVLWHNYFLAWCKL